VSAVAIVAEHDGKNLAEATAKTLTCARSIPDAQCDVAVFADDGRAIAEQAAALAGVRQVVLVEDELHSHLLAATLAPRIAELAEDYSHVFGPSTTFGRDVMPRVAALLGTIQISEVMAAETGSRFRRPIYAGNAIATVEVSGQPVVATVRVASFEATATGESRAPIVERELTSAVPAHTRLLERTSAREDRIDLHSARRVVAGGRGIGEARNFRLVEELADALGAAIGASRAAVDAGYVPNELQVGQTGKIIAPELYIAAGISGAIQHLTGIKDAGTIVAINNDAEAPIHKVADISLVEDLFAVLPELTEKLRERR
jgi:electron transfer flavoprotein alpha subunit